MNFLIANLLLIILLVILEYYFFRKINRSLKYLFTSFENLRIKTYKILFIVFINAYPIYAMIYFQYYALTSKDRFQIPQSTFMDYLLVYPFWIFLLLMIQCILFYVIIELAKLLSRLFQFPGEKRKRYDAIVTLLILLFFVVYIPARVYYDLNSIDVREITYRINSKNTGLHNFRITFISDLQADRYTDEKLINRYIEKVNNTHPDLVLIAGDFITSTPEYIPIAAKWTGRIHSKYGVYSCVGDHDNWAYRSDYARSLREISTALSHYNVKMISNGNMSFYKDKSRITVTFVTNTYVRSVSNQILDSLAQNSNDADLRIFLTHQPGQWLVSKAAEKNYDLMLAGHTHGGQITFLFPFKLLSPTLFETKYVRGDFNIRNLFLVVCRGLGVSILPLRYNSTPEIVSIIIK